MRQRFWLVRLGVVATILLIVVVSRPAKKPAEQTDVLSGGQNSSNQLSIRSNAPVPATPPVQPPTNVPSAKGDKSATPYVRPKVVPAPAPVPVAPDFSDPPPATVMENMHSAFHLFASRFGANPVGTNPEITKALTGDNPKQTTFIRPEDGLRINTAGELIDPWGTPFFFHQLSGKEMEIHSAGPDRVMWTDDDLVTK
jgi:hypothetical protein